MSYTSSAFVIVLLVLCCLDLCQSSPRSKRIKSRKEEREHCQLTSDPGSCTSKLRRWFYDSATEGCKTFTWTGCDGNDNRFRSRGQCERSCKDVDDALAAAGHTEDDESVAKVKPTPVTKCRRLPCKGLRCHHGYDRGFDDDGCHTCRCRSLPMTTEAVPLAAEVCRQMDCPGKLCPNGVQLDHGGCPTCHCLACPALSCPSHLNCRDGYVVDDKTGCERCECKNAMNSERLSSNAKDALPIIGKVLPVTENRIPVTETVLPDSENRELVKTSENLRPVRPETTRCPDRPQCFLQCSEGFAVDATGCEICACNENRKTAMHGDDAFLCRAVGCDISCMNGYATDENGCEICSCARKDANEADRKKKNNCPKTDCDPRCELKVDTTGCPVCDCKDDDVTGCDRTALVTCSLYCPGGYDRDSRGCEICDCRPLADEKVRDGTSDPVTCAPLNEVMCAERCELFYIRFDESGCEVCECVTGGEQEFTTPAFESDCPALFECTIECPEALERDERGCEICMCRRSDVDAEETGTADPEVTPGRCPEIECPLPCRLLTDEECLRCICDEPTEVNATQPVATCPDMQCTDTCPDGGDHVIDETGCTTCACADDRQTGSAIVVTIDPVATRESGLHDEFHYPNPTARAAWSDSLTTLYAPMTDEADDLEGSSTTTAAYPADVMCSGRSCNKKCIDGLRRNEGEECFICECNPESSRSEKRLVDVSVFNARKGICSLPAYRGPCHATLTRWNFNSQTGTCETFDYGGCRGYANNFRSKESCVEFCVAEVNQERATRQERFKEVLGF